MNNSHLEDFHQPHCEGDVTSNAYGSSSNLLVQNDIIELKKVLEREQISNKFLQSSEELLQKRNTRLENNLKYELLQALIRDEEVP